MNDTRILRVTGRGRLSLRPDTTRITITLEGTFPEYGEALKRSAGDTEILKDVLSELGFARTDLKTLRFDVDAEYESVHENGIYRQRFVGYKFVHVVKVDFGSDNERLGRILYALANGKLRPEFRISYTVKDPEAAKNELLGAAVADARAKAQVLAEAAGVTLGEIRRIDYSWGRIDLEVRPTNGVLMSKACRDEAAYDIDLEPDNIEVTDTVTVLWAIS
ncbi:MAG: SIMPL domain-containing protein [Oscillospiraceae bacterium]|nr:SIMPL domain-containing protein [Oscillospiraceae bacterium]